MGISKTDIFTKQQNLVAAYAKLFAHPARVAILQHLSTIKGCMCNSLVDKIGLAQPTISQHLKELKQMGIIKGKTEGASVCYCIDNKQWLKMKKEIHTFLDDLDISKENCC